MLRFLRRDKVISRAYEQAGTGGIESAVTVLRRAARVSDPNGDRTEAMGAILYQRGRWQDAAMAFRQSLAKDPTDMSRLNFLCSSLVRAGHPELAMKELDEYQGRFPADVAPPAIRCLVLAETEDYAGARVAYDRARQIFREHPSQQSLSMGFLQECAEAVAAFPGQEKP